MDFDERIKGIYRKGVSDRGECPATDDLIRYQQRELSTEDMLRLKHHIDVCGFCDYVFFQLSEFDSVPEGNWKESLKRFFFHPALAYAIALALLYPAYRGLFLVTSAPQKIVDGTGSAMDFDLGNGSVTRSRSSDEKTVVLLSPNEKFFILTFFVPVRDIYRYEMEIRNEQESLIDSKEIRSRDSIGNFSIVATRSLFQDGNYKLIVKEVESDNGVIKNEYNFHFRVEIKNRKNRGE